MTFAPQRGGAVAFASGAATGLTMVHGMPGAVANFATPLELLSAETLIPPEQAPPLRGARVSTSRRESCMLLSAGRSPLWGGG